MRTSLARSEKGIRPLLARRQPTRLYHSSSTKAGRYGAKWKGGRFRLNGADLLATRRSAQLFQAEPALLPGRANPHTHRSHVVWGHARHNFGLETDAFYFTGDGVGSRPKSDRRVPAPGQDESAVRAGRGIGLTDRISRGNAPAPAKAACRNPSEAPYFPHQAAGITRSRIRITTNALHIESRSGNVNLGALPRDARKAFVVGGHARFRSRRSYGLAAGAASAASSPNCHRTCPAFPSPFTPETRTIPPSHHNRRGGFTGCSQNRQTLRPTLLCRIEPIDPRSWPSLILIESSRTHVG